MLSDQPIAAEDWLNPAPMYAELHWPSFGKTEITGHDEPAPTRDVVMFDLCLLRSKRGMRPHLRITFFGFWALFGWSYS